MASSGALAMESKSKVMRIQTHLRPRGERRRPDDLG
jgi:hypothetical protein